LTSLSVRTWLPLARLKALARELKSTRRKRSTRRKLKLLPLAAVAPELRRLLAPVPEARLVAPASLELMSPKARKLSNPRVKRKRLFR
jgi:hypothetical protein